MDTNISLGARFFIGLIKLSGLKRRFASPPRLLSSAQAMEQRHAPSGGFRRRFDVSQSTIGGFPCYTVSPRKPALPRTHVLYLHGGAFVLQMTPLHWWFLSRLIEATGCSVTVPIYPLAPRHTYHEAGPIILEIYQRVLAQNDPGSIVLMGDSAGGTLALLLAQQLLALGLQQPARIILLSPLIDTAMGNPEMLAIEADDPMLALAGARVATELFAGGEEGLHTFWMNPIRGPLTGLPPVSLFVGTRDIVWPDSRRFRALAAQAGLSLDYQEYPGMFHIWMLLPFKEGRRAFAEICHQVIFHGDESEPTSTTPHVHRER